MGEGAMRRWAVLASLILVGVVKPVAAHELRPGYLELRETGSESFEVLWKVPAKGDLRLAIDAQIPETCFSAKKNIHATEQAWVERWTARCPGGLIGQKIHIEGLSATMTDVLVRVERQDKTSQVLRLRPQEPSFVVEAAPSRTRVAKTYSALGIEHILLGVDHLLFLLALLLIVKGKRRLIGAITAFTFAHSITLAAASLGLVHVPQAPVEAIIALSIAFVAAEILHARQGRISLTESRPWIVAFIFGLLHGLGFAGALSEIGLPQGEIPLALLMFNLGVEFGQLLFIGAVLLLLGLLRRFRLSFPRGTGEWPAYAIGGVAMFWVIQRVTSYLT
jgi:hydrogenase/urease accessory protein HupE